MRSDECNRLSVQIDAIHRKLKKAKGPEKAELLRQEKKLKLERTRVPCASKTDKVMKYIRYADDFIVGVKGDRQDCEMLKQLFAVFISKTLHMELSDEKTLITYSSQSARFLGYDVRVRRNQTLKPHGNHRSRTLNNKVELLIPFTDKIIPFLFDKAIIRQNCDGMILPAPRKYMYRCTDLEILMTYNWELRGICNYYSIASNFTRLDYFDYLMKYSCLKTLAGKHNSTSRKIISRFHMSDGGWGISYETRNGRKYCVFAKYTDAKCTTKPNERLFFPNTHEAIIDQTTWDQAQKMGRRCTRRKPNGSNTHMLFGLTFYLDCGKKMALVQNQTGGQGYAYSFRCRDYKNAYHTCTAHSISASALVESVRLSLKVIAQDSLKDEEAFRARLTAQWAEQHSAEMAEWKKELIAANKRITELDKLIRGLYEDRQLGRMPARQVDRLMMQYDQE